MSVTLDTSITTEVPLFEIIDGQCVEVPHMGASEAALANYLAFLINEFGLRSIGIAYVKLLFDLQIGRNRRPDLAFVRYDRWPRGRRIPPGEAWCAVPNLAVEVVSPTNTQQELLDKLYDYFRAGVELVWFVYPEHRQVYVYNSVKDVRIFDRADVLSGGQVVPGFELPLATLFEAEREEVQDRSSQP